MEKKYRLTKKRREPQWNEQQITEDGCVDQERRGYLSGRK
jgi:hypothetical protein